jgi:DNA mismatch repair protein MutS
VIGEARRYMALLEAGSLASQRAAGAAQAELPLFAPAAAPPAAEPGACTVDALRLRLAAIEPDELTPRRALELLYELRQLARSVTR